eukprot:5750694-Amphidinium_carterae.1
MKNCTKLRVCSHFLGPNLGIGPLGSDKNFRYFAPSLFRRLQDVLHCYSTCGLGHSGRLASSPKKDQQNLVAKSLIRVEVR